MEQLVVDEHEGDAAEEEADDGDDDVLSVRLLEVERGFDAEGPEDDEQDVLDDGHRVEDQNPRLRVDVLHVDVAEDVDVGQDQGPEATN